MFRDRSFGIVSIVVVMILMILYLDNALAQNTPLPQSPTNTAGVNRAGPVSLLSNYEFWLTISVMIFGLATMGASLYASHSEGSPPDQIIRVISVNLIVVGTLVTITAGLSDKQIAPAFGLFGTIAGYLLGRTERGGQTDTKPDVSEKKLGDPQ